MLTNIISQIPIWVAPLFILLLILGIRATKTRSVPLVIIYALPLLALLSLQSLSRLPDQALVWPLYVVFYGLGAVLGFRLQQRWIIAKHARHVEVAGEWLTLATMMFIFALSFAIGMVRSIAPTFLENPLNEIILVALVAIVGGIFIGRTVRVWRA